MQSDSDRMCHLEEAADTNRGKSGGAAAADECDCDDHESGASVVWHCDILQPQ